MKKIIKRIAIFLIVLLILTAVFLAMWVFYIFPHFLHRKMNLWKMNLELSNWRNIGKLT